MLRKAKEKQAKLEIKVEISEKQFDDILLQLLRQCQTEIDEKEKAMQHLMRTYADKQRDKLYPDTQLTYFAKKTKGCSDVSYVAKQADKIGFF